MKTILQSNCQSKIGYSLCILSDPHILPPSPPPSPTIPYITNDYIAEGTVIVEYNIYKMYRSMYFEHWQNIYTL